MERWKKDRAHNRMNPELLSPVLFGGYDKSLWALLFASLVVLSACVGGSSTAAQSAGPLAGNWQFTMTPPPDNSFLGGMQGGFVLTNKNSVTGGVVYSVGLPGKNGGPPTVCNSGSAPVTGTINGQSVTLTAVAGTQTFTLNGTLSADGSTMMGTYTSTDGNNCGTAQTGLPWSATSVPPMTGTIQGSFHSEAGGALNHQDFPVSGVLNQGDNIGASNATVTGTLTFQGYPCLDTASVNGQISGNSVILQIIAGNGLNVGQIGAPVGSPSLSPLIFENTTGGSVLHGAKAYAVSTKICSTPSLPPDIGNVCLALGNATACTQPISLSPVSLTFPPQAVGSPPTAQTITLTNTDPSGSPLVGLTIPDLKFGGTFISGNSDFSGLPGFTERDTCAPPGLPFSLGPQQSCSITISFSPQQSCPWQPFLNPLQNQGEPPSLCPFPLTAVLTVNSPRSATDDGDTIFTVPSTGVGLSAIVPSTPELDFGSEAPSERSPSQLLSFTNQGNSPVQILPAVSTPCKVPPDATPVPLQRPLLPGVIAGFQVDAAVSSPSVTPPTISYTCDYDQTSGETNFQISADSCTGRVLAPQDSCGLEVAYVPQPFTYSKFTSNGLDYFLELNTLECTANTTSNCEIDSGRFPVELRANLPSPLRMSPGAGLDFGTWMIGQPSDPKTITLFNDPKDPNSETVNFTGNLVKGDFTEVDDCGASLAPGSSCTLTITFNPKIVGFDQGTLTISYILGQTQTVYLRGTGQ